MSVATRGLRRLRLPRRPAGFLSGIAAVTTKELRGRMRGRRAFVVLTVYLLLLSLLAYGLYLYQKATAPEISSVTPGLNGGFTGAVSSTGALSSGVGHFIFAGLLFVETLLVVVLAPAFTSGAISLEREKQTIDMLVTTPLSSLAVVLGKLVSALVYVLLLIVASIPLASIVFTFGGVGPEDLVRGYAFLFALAFGMGAIGLFVSALVKRTQTATVVTYVTVLGLALGTMAVWELWDRVADAQPASGFSGAREQRAIRPPAALLWLNPFAADIDIICGTSPSGYDRTCEFIGEVTGRTYFGTVSDFVPGSGSGSGPGFGGGAPGFGGADPGVGVPPDRPVPAPAIDCPPGTECAPMAPPVECERGQDCPVTSEPCPPGATCGQPSFQEEALAFPRDTFWPQSASAFLVVGVVLTLLSTQLVAPTRRLRLPRIRGRGRSTTAPPAEVTL